MSDPGPLYELCTDDDCPVAYAYRHPFPATPHYHYKGAPVRIRVSFDLDVFTHGVKVPAEDMYGAVEEILETLELGDLILDELAQRDFEADAVDAVISKVELDP